MMIDLSEIKDYLQNKNFVMCITSLFFMFGILSYFGELEIVSSVILTVLLILLLILRIFSVKRVIFLALIFYFGFFLTFFRVSRADDLLPLASLNSDFYGRIVSVPNSAEGEKSRFFFNVERCGDDSITGRALVTVSGDKSKIEKLNIGQKVKINGSLRKPFVSTNPSQFDYARYLKNFGVFTVIYSDKGQFEIIPDKKNVSYMEQY